MTPDQTKEIKAAIERINKKSVYYAPFYAYYDGRHTWNFSSQKFKNKYGQRLQTLRENLCRAVVKAPASRLEVTGFQSDTDDIQTSAWDIWKRSSMPRQSGIIHREAFKTGDAYMIVWPNEENKALFFPNSAASITVWKDPDTDDVTKAAKLWRSEGLYYLTIYYPDRIEKYISSKKVDGTIAMTDVTFKPREVAGEAWPVTNPYNRVPVFHFTFENEMAEFGRSLLTDVIPLNDALNKSYADIFVAQEYNSMRQRWITGLRAEDDEESGKKIEPYKPDDSIWIAEDTETSFGQFEESDLEKLLKVKQEAVSDIALVSGIPPSYFNLEQAGQAMSGEALRKIEARFIALIQDSQRSFGEVWASAVQFALEIEGNIGKTVEVQWSDAAPISESELLDNGLKKKNLGWSVEQIQRDFGVAESQIEEMSGANAEREKTKVENAAKFFDGGLS